MGYTNGVYTPPTGAENAAAGQVIRSATWNTVHIDISAALTTIGQGVSLEFAMSGSGSPISTGLKGYLECPMDLTINSWKILADRVGSIVIDIWKVPFASFPPSVANTITGSALPTITTAQSNSSSTLTGWTTTISRSNILAFNVNSCSTIQQVTISLDCGRN